jgi:integrase
MSDRKETTHILIARKLTLYRRPRSSVWQCKYKIEGRWRRATTHERDFESAKKRAYDILIEAQVRIKLNVVPFTRKFKDVAMQAILRIDKELQDDYGKVIYKEYKIAINKYMIPFLGNYNVDSIGPALLQEFDEFRIKKMGRVPKLSTLQTHNAAMNRIFDEAELRGYLKSDNRPKLVAKAKKGGRRAGFNLDEVRAIKQNFDAWIECGRADSVAVRYLLRDYVNVLLDTGARPGKELLDLRWTQIELQTTQDDNPIVILKIQTGKTGKRSAIGRKPTLIALDALAKRNHESTTVELVHNSKAPIFRFVEYLNEDQVQAGQTPQLLPPTSFSKLFHTYLEDHNLLIDPITNQKRVLYSLRHTYATMALTYDQVEAHTLAKQMGTSIAMIEKHYSHLDVVKAVHQLQGVASRSLIEAAGVVDERYMFDGTSFNTENLQN